MSLFFFFFFLIVFLPPKSPRYLCRNLTSFVPYHNSYPVFRARLSRVDSMYVPDIYTLCFICTSERRLVCWLLELYVLAISKLVSGWVQNLRQYICIATLLDLSTDKQGHQNHDMIPDSVILSWCWSQPVWPYPNNAERLATKWQV